MPCFLQPLASGCEAKNPSATRGTPRATAGSLSSASRSGAIFSVAAHPVFAELNTRCRHPQSVAQTFLSVERRRPSEMQSLNWRHQTRMRFVKRRQNEVETPLMHKQECLCHPAGKPSGICDFDRQIRSAESRPAMSAQKSWDTPSPIPACKSRSTLYRRHLTAEFVSLSVMAVQTHNPRPNTDRGGPERFFRGGAAVGEVVFDVY